MLIDSVLTLVLLNCLFPFFFHLKLELLTQFPASNDEKILVFIDEKSTSSKLHYLINRASGATYLINFSDMSLSLEHAQNRMYQSISDIKTYAFFTCI